MAIKAIQTSFAKGELSDRLRGRFDTELYGHGLDLCENYRPLPHGPLIMRGASEHLWNLENAKRIIHLRTSSTKEYLLALFAGSMLLYKIEDGALTAELVATRQMCVNGDFSAGGVGWLTRGTFTGANFPTTGAQAGRCLIPVDGLLYQKITTPIGCKQVTVKARFFGEGAAHFPVMKVSTTDPAGWAVAAAGGVHHGVYDAGGEIREFAYPENPTGVWSRTTVVALPAGDYWVSFEPEYGTEAFHIDDVEVEFTAADGQSFAIVTPWNAAEAPVTQFCTETGRDRTIFVHEAHQPWAIWFKRSGVWEFDKITFGPTPEKWGDNAGEGGVPNWPATVEVDNGRVIYGGEPEARNRVLCSKAGAADNFNLASGEGDPAKVLPGDAIDIKLATKGAIRWIQGTRNLLVGTDIEERSLGGSKGVILADDYHSKRESAFGSAAIRAVDAGTFALYVSADRRKIRALAYDLQTSGWNSKDITFAAEHITEPLIKELHHVFTPDGLIIALLDDGSLAMCSFDPAEEVAAWWTAKIGGTIISAAPSSGPSGAFLWMLVDRAGTTRLERMPLSTLAAARYLDASIAAVADGAGVVVGLAHLEGMAVTAISAGIIAKEGVVAGGALALGAEYAGAAVVVGLRFVAKAITLPKDVRGGKTRSPTIGLIVNESALPKINGYRAEDRSTSTNFDTPEPPRSGKVEVTTRGWDGEGKIVIEQDLPFRTEVLAIYQTVQANEV